MKELVYALVLSSGALCLAYTPNRTVSTVRPGRCIHGEQLQDLAKHVNVSSEELLALGDVCIPPDINLQLDARRLYVRNGIPDGVECEARKWCDSQGVCSSVCATGTVKIDPWYQWASAWQRKASLHRPLCYASLLGTHNSAITLANGYGNQDPYWQSFFKYVPNMDGAVLRTNNQWLSLTDQLNLGVRLLELDTHWVAGHLRVGHCGGLHAPLLNALLKALNTLSKLFGQHVHWDTETVGCSPSLSAIPTKDQRLLSDTLAELRVWMDRPENADEFLVLFLDDEKDLKSWGKVGLVINQLLDAFPAEWLLTPPEKELIIPGVWPSVAELLTLGKRLLVISRQNYGAVMSSHIFPKQLCNWTEPALHKLSGPPGCEVKSGGSSQDGVFYRINDCKLVYGPLNCNFSPASAADAFDVLTDDSIATATQCAWNSISPDLLTPESVSHTIWSWAPGEPAQPQPLLPLQQPDTAAAAADAAPVRQSPTRKPEQAPEHSVRLLNEPAQPGGGGAHVANGGAAASDVAAGAGATDEGVYVRLSHPEGAPHVGDGVCAAISAADERWRCVDCDAALLVACRRVSPFRRADGAAAGTANEHGDARAAAGGGDLEAGGLPLWVLGGAAPGAAAQDAPWGVRADISAGGTPENDGFSGLGGSCPQGYAFSFPETGKENSLLAAVLRAAGADRALLALTGPDFLPRRTAAQ